MGIQLSTFIFTFFYKIRIFRIWEFQQNRSPNCHVRCNTDVSPSTRCHTLQSWGVDLHKGGESLLVAFVSAKRVVSVLFKEVHSRLCTEARPVANRSLERVSQFLDRFRGSQDYLRWVSGQNEGGTNERMKFRKQHSTIWMEQGSKREKTAPKK